MKLSTLMAFIGLLLNISICFGQMHYQSYTNHQLFYSIDYPTELFSRGQTYEAKFTNPFNPNFGLKIPQEIGIKFNNDDANLTVWAEVVWEPEQIDMQSFLEYHTKGYQITDQLVNDNFYKASGYVDDSTFFYRHTELLDTVLYTLWINYDISKEATYNPVVKTISDSFTLPISGFKCNDSTEGVEETICEHGSLSLYYAQQAKLFEYLQNSHTVPEHIKTLIKEQQKMVGGVYNCPGTTGIKGFMCMVNHLSTVIGSFTIAKYTDLEVQNQISYYKSLDR